MSLLYDNVRHLRLAPNWFTQALSCDIVGLDPNEYAIYATLKPNINGIDTNLPKGINSLVATYPDYLWNEQQQKKLRAQLYQILLPIVGANKMIETANSLLRLQRV